jgi:hypothetical protein
MTVPHVVSPDRADPPAKDAPVVHEASASGPSLVREIASHLALDVPLIVIAVIYCAIVLPLVPRWTDNAPMLAAFTNDEPFITQQLDGMTIRPYGNPSNFLETKNADKIPAYWGGYRYYNLIYYGGTYLDLGFAAYAPAKALGAPAFPTAPIVLRTISFLAGLLSVMLLYNFAKRHAGRFAAIFAATALMFEFNFIYMATTIHPDMLQLALSLLALIIAVRHARVGDWRSVIALGAVIGLIQGTKSGTPYLVPMVLLAALVGAWARPVEPGSNVVAQRLVGTAGRLAVAGIVAVIAFVISTPYILFDPYYLRTTRGALSILSSTSPLIPISFSTWYQHILADLGWLFVIVLVAGVAWFLAQSAAGRRLDTPLTLALVLGASNVLWFTGVGRFWVVLYYLLAGLGIFAIFAGRLIAQAASAIDARLPWRWPMRVALALVLIVVAAGSGRANALAQAVAGGVDAGRTPQFRLAHWAQSHVPAKSNILFDDEAYFDPSRFPVQATNAGVIRYTDLITKRPDYFVLTDVPPGTSWITAKRLTQHFGKWNDDPYSVRLYQDLIDRSKAPFTPGPTPVAHVSLVQAVGLPADDEVGQPAWFHWFDSLNGFFHPHAQGLQSALSTSHRLLLYRVEPPFYRQKTPFGFLNPTFTPISSASAPGNATANAFDGTGQVWLAQGQGSAVDGAYIGVNYGTSKGVVDKVEIKWVAGTWLPPLLRIESSDDGVHWRVVLSRKEVIPADQNGSPGLKRWTETIAVPKAGPHRMWRIAAADVRPENYFGVDELEFLR